MICKTSYYSHIAHVCHRVAPNATEVSQEHFSTASVYTLVVSKRHQALLSLPVQKSTQLTAPAYSIAECSVEQIHREVPECSIGEADTSTTRQIAVLGHDFALQGYTGPGTTWANTTREAQQWQLVTMYRMSPGGGGCVKGNDNFFKRKQCSDALALYSITKKLK